MGKNEQYLDTEAEQLEWAKFRDKAREFLKDRCAIEKKIASIHAKFIDPRKPAKVGWYSVKVPDGIDEETNQRKYKEVRRAEYQERKKIFKSEPVCAAICNKIAIEEKIKEWELWYKAIARTERTLDGAEKCILAVWRTPETKAANKEDICYQKFGRTWAYSTMEKCFNIVANRCAAYAEMLGAPVE